MHNIYKIISVATLAPIVAMAADTCPTGYIAVNDPYVVISLTGTCDAGYISLGNVSTCTSGGGVCYNVCPNLPANAHWVNTDTCTYECNSGWFMTDAGVCTQMCPAGVTKIRTSTGISVPLYATRQTSPSLNVDVNGMTCYGKLAAGSAPNAINVQYNGNTYHTID